jgi:hypothetical protein
MMTILWLHRRRQALDKPFCLSAQPELKTGQMAFAPVPGRDGATIPRVCAGEGRRGR